MNRSIYGLVFALLIPMLAAQGGSSAQIEFVAQLESIQPSTGGISILELRLTPQFSILTRVTPSTELRDQSDSPITLDDLAIGDTLKVEGFFTPDGILAREIEITNDTREFELQGILDMVSLPDRVITLLGFPVEVPPEAEIEDAGGRLLSFDELTAGQFVKVEGMVVGGALVARQVKVGDPAPDFALVRFNGTVLELDANSLLVEISGGQTVLVEITQSTIIEGILTVGGRVEVRGRLTPRLAVEALRIEVRQLVRLVPDEVHLDFSQSRRIDVLLASPLTEDIALSLTSRDPLLAETAPVALAIPAGKLLASFQVTSGNREGTTFVDVALPAVVGGSRVSLKVEVESDQPDDMPGSELVEVKWNPRKIEAGPEGTRQVQLTLNRPAPEDLMIALFLKEGQPGAVTFPSQAVIPSGARSTSVEIRINRLGERSKIRAQLPAAVGGDTDDLDIDLRGQQSARRRLQWNPDDLELRPGSQAMVELTLDQPAPFDFEVPIVVREGDPSLASGIPPAVTFSQGQQSVSFAVLAGASEGRVRYRATLPFQLGGESDELKVEIED